MFLILKSALQTHHVYFTLKRRGNGCFWMVDSGCIYLIFKLIKNVIKTLLKTLLKIITSNKNVIKPFKHQPYKMVNRLKQFVGKLPTNCLSVFDHFVKVGSHLRLFQWLSSFFHTAFIAALKLFTGRNIQGKNVGTAQILISGLQNNTVIIFSSCSFTVTLSDLIILINQSFKYFCDFKKFW